jgi:tetratricopeptide (TPR) repeat protein
MGDDPVQRGLAGPRANLKFHFHFYERTLQRPVFMAPSYQRASTIHMRRFHLPILPAVLVLIAMLLGPPVTRADDANTAKARELVNTAINMTDSAQAVKLLWQATDLDPTFEQPYIYLGFYYNSRSNFAEVVQVYKKLAKYRPNDPNVYLNIGEAYMSLSPPQLDDALANYRKAYALDKTSSFAAFRIGEVLAQRPGGRDEAIKYLRIAAADSAKNPSVAAEAQKVLAQMGAM